MLQIWRDRPGRGFHASQILIESHEEIFRPERNVELLRRYKDIYGDGDEYNLYYTIGTQKAENTREMQSKSIIAFDIDNVNYKYEMDLFDLLAELTNTAQFSCGRVRSGYGCHYVIYLNYLITPEENERLFPVYKACCKIITEKVKELGYAEKCDSQIWDKSRLLRLPSSINRKPEKGEDRECYLHAGMFEQQEFNLLDMLKQHGVEVPQEAKSLAHKDRPAAPYDGPTYVPDSELIFSACAFLRKELATGGSESDEPTWRAALSIAAHIDQAKNDGEWTLSHDISKGHKDYKYEETQAKIERVLEVPPRTCSSIDSPECESCVFRGKLGSPYGIQGKHYDIFKSSLTEAKNPKEIVKLEKLDPNGSKVVNNATEFKGFKIEDMALEVPKVKSAIANQESDSKQDDEEIYERIKNVNAINKQIEEAPNRLAEIYKNYSEDILKCFSLEKWDAKLTKILKYERDYSRLVKFYKDIYHYKVLLNPTKIIAWNGWYYEEQSEDAIRAFAQKWFGGSGQQNIFQRETSEFYHTLKTTNIAKKGWNTYPRGKINLLNGILDIKTMKLEPSSPDYYFTHVLDYDYDPTARCPTFDLLTERVFQGDETRKQAILEYLGYCVTGDEYKYNLALFMVGDGSNGKSGVIRAMQMVLGDENCSSIALEDFHDSAKLANIEGKLANFCDEVDETSFLRPSVFKKLVGNTPVQLRPIWKEPRNYLSYTKLVLSMNEIPKLREQTKGLKRRLYVVPCEQDYEDNPELMIKNHLELLAQEKAGILNLALKAYEHVLQRGGFIRVNGGLELLNFMFGQSLNVFNVWADETIEVTKNPDDYVPIKELYNDYFGLVSGHCNQVQFGKDLTAWLRKKKLKDIGSTAIRINGTLTRVTRGIKFTKYVE